MEMKKKTIFIDHELHQWYKKRAADLGATITVLVEMQLQRHKTDVETREKWEQSRNKNKKK